jgi:hypothetical protein
MKDKNLKIQEAQKTPNRVNSKINNQEHLNETTENQIRENLKSNQRKTESTDHEGQQLTLYGLLSISRPEDCGITSLKC